MKTFYGVLQRIALVPLTLFLWSGLADELLGWPNVLPSGLGASHGPSLLAVFGTGIETLAPVGLLFHAAVQAPPCCCPFTRSSWRSSFTHSGRVMTAAIAYSKASCSMQRFQACCSL